MFGMYKLSALRQNQALLASGLIPFAASSPYLDPVGRGATFCKAERNLGARGAGGRAHSGWKGNLKGEDYP